MKTKIFGKKIERIYSVDSKQAEIQAENGKTKVIYTAKPELVESTIVSSWIELFSYIGEPRYNYNSTETWIYPYNNIRLFGKLNQINISANETVFIEEEIFRADLNEMHLHTNKIIEEIEVDKEKVLSVYKTQLRLFNRKMIESNDKLRRYCDLHKLQYEDTDCIELFKLLFPDDEYVIEDGTMKVMDKAHSSQIYLSSRAIELEPIYI